MPESDRLHEVTKGDRPSASQQNIIVRTLKKSIRDGRQRNFTLLPWRVRVSNGWTAFETLQIDDIVSDARRALAYSTQALSCPNSDNFDVLICDGASGWASFGLTPVLAAIDGSSPVIGAQVGPLHGEDALRSGQPGFRYLGDSNISGVGWVIRDRAIATGQGYVITSSGQTGIPASFELETVTFSSGFDGWDHISDLSVVNVFGDTAEAGIIVQFKWDVYTGEYVSTDVECP